MSTYVMDKYTSMFTYIMYKYTVMFPYIMDKYKSMVTYIMDVIRVYRIVGIWIYIVYVSLLNTVSLHYSPPPLMQCIPCPAQTSVLVTGPN